MEAEGDMGECGKINKGKGVFSTEEYNRRKKFTKKMKKFIEKSSQIGYYVTGQNNEGFLAEKTKGGHAGVQ